MAATLPERRHDRPSHGPAVRLEDSLDGCYADVREIDVPNEDGAGLELLQRAQGGAQRGDGTGLWLRILYDHAVVAGNRVLDPGRIAPPHNESRFYLEFLHRLDDSVREGAAQDIHAC